MEEIRNYEKELAALKLKKQELMREQEALIQELLVQIQKSVAQKQTEKLTRLIESGVRLGIAISKPGYEGKWIDITEAAIKLAVETCR